MAEPSPEEDLVLAATFLSIEEANLGRALLRDADIPAYLENELTSAWTGTGGLRLMVPGSRLEQAQGSYAQAVRERQIVESSLTRQSSVLKDRMRAVPGCFMKRHLDPM